MTTKVFTLIAVKPLNHVCVHLLPTSYDLNIVTPVPGRVQDKYLEKNPKL